MTSTPLMVVDVQNGFVNHRSRHIVPAVVDLVAAWERAGQPVWFTRYYNHPSSPFVQIMGWDGLQNSPDTDIVAELAEPFARAEAACRYVDKVRYGAFALDVLDTFRDEGWTDVALCGIATDSCVLQTAAQAFEAGITPWVVTDACASEAGDDVHQAGLTVLRRLIGRRQLINAQDAAARFTVREGHAA